jgi:Fe-S-cluster containining protein
MIDGILRCYGQLLKEVDEWFSGCLSRYPELIHCHEGCSACCRGLFDITLLDACYLRHGFQQLPEASQEAVVKLADKRLTSLCQSFPNLVPPFILNDYAEDDLTRLMPDDDTTPCVLLGGDGRCILYANRPMTCRLHGLPLIDFSGEVFDGQYCTMNSLPPLETIPELRWKFRSHFSTELELFHRFTKELLGEPMNELDTLIPLSLLIDYEKYGWKEWMAERQR